jgi:hypothetical protein
LGLGPSSELLSAAARSARIFDWGVSGVPGGDDEASESDCGREEEAIGHPKRVIFARNWKKKKKRCLETALE